jgi:hypothetical protein
MERGAQILQWDYPQSFLYSNSETAAKVAYAQTIYHFSSAAGSAQSPTPGEITAYFTERQHDFENASSQDRWKLANTAVLGVATLAGGVGALYGAETLTVGTLLQASPALIGGSGNAVSSINDAMKMSDADLNAFLSNKVNENLPNIVAAGFMNPDVQKPLAAFLLTGITNPTSAQVIATYNNLPATKGDLQDALTTSQYPMPLLLTAYRRIIQEEIKKGVPLTEQDRQLIGKLLTSIEKASQAQDLLTPKSDRLDSAGQKAVLDDVKYFTSTLHDLGIAFHVSPTEQAEIDRTLGLVERSAALSVALAATSVNPLAVAASGASIIALLFGPETTGPNPFQLIMDQILALQKEVNQLAFQVQQLRTEIDAQFSSLQTAIYQLSLQVQVNREVMLSHFDTILAEIRGISENKNLDDWAAFHTSVNLIRGNYPQSNPGAQMIVMEIRKDRVREDFARLLNHLEPGKGGAGAQGMAGPENCFDELIAKILQEGKETFLNEALSLAESMEKPDFDQRAYCVAGVARELLDGMPKQMEPWLSPEYSMMLPVDVERDGSIKPWQKDRYVVSSPLDIATFLYRIQPEIATLPDAQMRAELSAKLLDSVSPLIRSYGVTNGASSAQIIAVGYQGMSVNLAKRLSDLLLNPYQKALVPLAEWMTNMNGIYGGADKFHDAFFPVSPTWSDDHGHIMNLYQMVYDTSRHTKQTIEEFNPKQRAALAAKAAAVDQTSDKILGGLVAARNASLQKLGNKPTPQWAWNGLKISVDDVDSFFKRHIPTAEYPDAFQTETVDYKTALKKSSAREVASRSLDGVYKQLFLSLELNIKCTWYAQPFSVQPVQGDNNSKGAITPVPKDLEVPQDCSDKFHLSPRKWEDLQTNYSHLLGGANDAFNGAFPSLMNGLSSYLSATKEPATVDSLERRIIATAFAMKVVETLYQRRSKAALSQQHSARKQSNRPPALGRLSTFGEYIDGILKQTSTAQKESAYDRFYLEEMIIQRPKIQTPTSPVTLPLFKHYDYPNASMFYPSIIQMDPLRVNLPETKDLIAKPRFSTKPNSKQMNDTYNYLATPEVSSVSANQAVTASVQQYEIVREMLSFANLEILRPEQAKAVSTDVDSAPQIK